LRSVYMTWFCSLILDIFSKYDMVSPHKLPLSSDVQLVLRSGSVPSSDIFTTSASAPSFYSHPLFVNSRRINFAVSFVLNFPHFLEENTNIQEYIPHSNMLLLVETSQKYQDKKSVLQLGRQRKQDTTPSV
jgi:hypothetical protein